MATLIHMAFRRQPVSVSKAGSKVVVGLISRYFSQGYFCHQWREIFISYDSLHKGWS